MGTGTYKQQIPAFEVINEVKKAVIGKDDCIVMALAAILAGGHILLNDIPGVGKTTLAMALSKSMSLKQNRCNALRFDRVFYVSKR